MLKMKLLRSLLLTSILAVATVVAPMAASGFRSTRSKMPSCNDAGWAATAAGKPAALASAGGPSFYVWRDARSWHLAVKAASNAAPLIAQVQSSAPVRVVDVTPALSANLRVSRRIISVRAASVGLKRLDFATPCSRSLRFRLGVAEAGAGSGGAIRPGPTPVRAFLGASGLAPALSFRLSRPAVTGVSGRILVGPTCPSIGPGSDCPPAKSGAGTVRVETASLVRGGAGGELVTRVQSDADGNFSVALPPGRYLLVVEKSAAGYPVAKPSVVDVEPGAVSEVILVLDTGIR
jgi:hypothetical protein